MKNYGKVRDNIIGIYATEEEACKAAEFDNRFKDKITSTMGSLVYIGEVNEKYDPSNIYDKCEFCVRMPFMFDKDLSLIATQTWSIRPIIEFDRFNKWKKKPDKDINSEMKKVNNFFNILKKGINNSYNDDKKLFLDKLSKTRDQHTLNNAANKIYEVINNKRKLILKHHPYQ